MHQNVIPSWDTGLVFVTADGSMYLPYLIEPKKKVSIVREESHTLRNSIIGVEVCNGVAIPLAFLPAKKAPKMKEQTKTTPVNTDFEKKFFKSIFGQ